MVEQMVTCSSCSAQTPLVIEGFMGGKMFCPRCAEVTKAVLRGIGRRLGNRVPTARPSPATPIQPTASVNPGRLDSIAHRGRRRARIWTVVNRHIVI